MLKAFELLFAPVRAWEGISRGEPSVAGVLLRHFLPLLLLVSAVEGWCLVRFGTQLHPFEFSHNQLIEVSRTEAIRFEVTQGLISCLSVLLLAIGLQTFLRSFHCRASFRLSLTVMAFSYSQLLLLQAVDGVPAAPTWMCRIIGAVLAAKALYVGLVRVCRPDPSTALGLYFLGALLIFFVAGLSHFIALLVLDGRLLPPWPWVQGSG